MRRKLAVLLIFLFPGLGIGAQNYGKLFLESANVITCGLTVGGVKDCNYDYGFAVGADLCALGFVLDLQLSPAAYGGTTEVGTWDDAMSYSWHLGYMLPVTSWLRLGPVYGRAVFMTGSTDGYHYTVTKYGVENTFLPDRKYVGSDLGGRVEVVLPDFPVAFEVTVSRLCLSVGFNLAIRDNY